MDEAPRAGSSSAVGRSHAAQTGRNWSGSTVCCATCKNVEIWTGLTRRAGSSTGSSTRSGPPGGMPSSSTPLEGGPHRLSHARVPDHQVAEHDQSRRHRHGEEVETRGVDAEEAHRTGGEGVRDRLRLRPPQRSARCSRKMESPMVTRAVVMSGLSRSWRKIPRWSRPASPATIRKIGRAHV